MLTLSLLKPNAPLNLPGLEVLFCLRMLGWDAVIEEMLEGVLSYMIWFWSASLRARIFSYGGSYCYFFFWSALPVARARLEEEFLS